ncbi:hypothetical protein SAMN04487936_10447 [Halobacillus dabanensis]|uniref:Uncharacterized protein n=1 Tax=Halobacillus dabanensis TaxID=240302 RepID=A0A1I3TVI8_HALDA|nr:hypothetical protein [Halobacillus dabanensis]SFJ75288.1 hypothetical protein SAMN04487936_10447 [Halobacillus dabanensis]
MDPTSRKLLEWRKKNMDHIEEIKERISQLKKQTRGLKVISFFTYSTHFFYDSSSESMIFGSYHVQNLGDRPFIQPYICLKISPESPFHFSGKYVYKDSIQKMKMSGAWERLNEATEKEEYWLRPSGKDSIEPGETLTFSNFQLKWTSEQKYAGSMMGFTYGEEETSGIAALNNINVSGTPVGREEKSNE